MRGNSCGGGGSWRLRPRETSGKRIVSRSSVGAVIGVVSWSVSSVAVAVYLYYILYTINEDAIIYHIISCMRNAAG